MTFIQTHVRAIIELSYRTIWDVITEEGSYIPVPDRNVGYYLHTIAYGSCLMGFICTVDPDCPDEIKNVPDLIPEMMCSICNELDNVAVTEPPPLPKDPVWWKRLIMRHTMGREEPLEDLRTILERHRTGRDMATELYAIPGVVSARPGMR